MYTIQANPSGTRSIEVSSENLKTIEKYALFRHLIDSTGIVDEPVLDKLKLNIRSLIASQEEDSKELLDLHLAFHSGCGRGGRIMITVDTCGTTAYSPLIPAIKAICEAPFGETLEIIMNHADAFQDLKEYLSEQSIGFREIYDGEQMTLQFTINEKF